MNTLKLRLKTWALLLLITGAALSLRAETSPEFPDAAGQTNWIAKVSEKLGLSDAQKTKVEPILKDSFEKRRAVLRQYQGQRSLRALRSLRRELEPIQKQTDSQLKSVLTKPQMKELEKLRAELKKNLRETLRERRDAK